MSAVKQQLVRGRAALAGLLAEDPAVAGPEPALVHRTEGLVMDALTERLHQAAEALPGCHPCRGPGPAQRRARPADPPGGGGVAAAGLLAVTAVGVGVLGGGDRSELAPAVPASRVWASPVGSVFTADPVMPKAGWVAMARGAWGELRSLDGSQAQALNDDKGIDMTGRHAATFGLHHGPVQLGR